MAEDLTHLVLKSNPDRGSLDAWRKELDDFIAMMQDFATEDPDTVLQQISTIAARLTGIRSQIVRVESRALQAFRTREVDPLLDQIQFQFRVNSRRLSMMSLDFEMTRHAPG